MRRHPKRFLDRPIDPRARDVTAVYPQPDRSQLLALSCGHVISRKYTIGIPERAICTTCPAVGGFGARMTGGI